MERMLKYYRQKNGMTQAELAGKAGLATVTIRKIENSERDPSNKTARKLSIIFNKKMDEVFPDIFLLSDDTKSIKKELKHSLATN
ncbi:helix-turn-helix transcriptional regulator [Clostridium botulinum]|jgi:DNA-binding XRE family transcriptional regulator|uniref:helix-turn-helix transcriptional regulator n=1 Tax=Clostridium botulinum TaxID=1491 RepID=UPI00217E03E8|nr:helix-turn-helix transcriptional regulator [Clostridium botulinum]MCS6105741.1 XRE family transcriptional regulator [Clostridium botulinum]